MTTTYAEPVTARPGKPAADEFTAVMRQDWREMLFLHWRVDRDEVAARLPAPLEVDVHGGAAWIGLVPFRVERVRPPALPPAPLVSTFGEVNVRTYVRGPDGEPGIWFFSLDADSRLAVESAKLLYRLPYFAADVRLTRDGAGGDVTFVSERRDGGARCRAVWRPAPGRGTPVAPGTLDEFLIERYVLFAESRGSLFRARVLHEDYPVHAAELVELEDELVHRAGFEVTGEPLVHASPGVDVEVSAPEPID
ncbi:MAG TPA: DUF2071 domain-containing protein [Thermoanaerobaculia bacterium]|nr:DUF2071 domain-containing protein [Thermoanaerobaculia bacterium]